MRRTRQGIAHNVCNTKHVNAVALCDVAMGTGHTAGTEKKFNGIPKFKDFRKMFDKMGKEIDAVTIGVPDHSHFPISMRAIVKGFTALWKNHWLTPFRKSS